MDKKKRSLIKSLTWRTSTSIVLMTIGWIFTRDIEQTTLMTIIYTIIQFILYYLHERIWEKIKWGRG